MTREIADSDGESEYQSLPRPSISPIEADVLQQSTPSLDGADPVMSIRLSQFLSPTQRISSQIGPRPSHRSGSTDSFLAEIAQQSGMQSAVMGTSNSNENHMEPKRPKRSYSDIEEGTSTHGERKDRQKKRKTYGQSSSQKSEAASSLFSNLGDIGLSVIDGQDNVDVSEPHSYELDGEDKTVPIPPHMALTYMSNNSEDLNRLVGNVNRHISTTASLIGTYQGLNMDFRGTGIGLDVNTNPFGTLSQVSVDTANAIPPNLQTSTTTHKDAQQADPESLVIPHVNAIDLMATSSVEEAAGRTGRDHEETEVAVHHPIAYHNKDSNYDIATLKCGDIVGNTKEHTVNERKSQSKRKGRTSRKTKMASDAAADLEENSNDIDELTLPDAEEASHIDDNSTIAVARADEAEKETKALGTRGRKKDSKQAVENKQDSKKSLSSELGLSDEILVGAPKEIYHVKPSRSRAKKASNPEVETESSEMQQNVKHAEDDVENGELSANEAEPIKKTSKVGKKKRGPSRKSKTTDEPAVETHHDLTDTGADNDVVNDNNETEATQLQHVDSHVDDEDTKQHDKSHHVSESAQQLSKGTLSATIPHEGPGEDAKHIAPEPKKRGRKRKKVIEVKVDVEDPKTEAEQIPDAVNEEVMQDPGRPALVEKSTNLMVDEAAHDDLLLSKLDEKQQIMQNDRDLKPQTPSTISARSTPVNKNSPSTQSSSSSSIWNKPRIGLSRSSRIPSLLRKLDRNKEPPKVVEKKEKLTKKQQEEKEKRALEAEVDGIDPDEASNQWKERGKDGFYVEWND